MNRRALLLASALIVPAAIVASPGAPLHVADARASVSVLLSLDEMIAGSTYVLIGTPSDRRSVWEDLPSGRRIVTYTKVTVERAVVGAPAQEVWVRTLGGVVGKIGQSVAGEAQLDGGKTALMFLAERDGITVVTAMAQGHFPVVADDKGVRRVRPSPDPGLLLAKRGPTLSAHEQLVGAAIDDAVQVVQKARKARDERK